MRWFHIIRRGIVFEVRLYVALMRWIARRPDVPTGARPWGYTRLAAPMMWLWIFGSATEIPLVHVLVPWHTVRIALLILGLWGLAWMVGFLASLKVYPHLTDDDGLRVRLGKRADVAIPWERIANVTTVDRDLDSSVRTFQPLTTANGIDLQIGVSGRANLHITLTEPMAVPAGENDLTVASLTFMVDDPSAMASYVRREVDRAATSSPNAR